MHAHYRKVYRRDDGTQYGVCRWSACPQRVVEYEPNPCYDWKKMSAVRKQKAADRLRVR